MNVLDPLIVLLRRGEHRREEPIPGSEARVEHEAGREAEEDDDEASVLLHPADDAPAPFPLPGRSQTAGRKCLGRIRFAKNSWGNVLAF